MADSNGVVQLPIPMFFRVKGTRPSSVPAGMVAIPGGTNSGTNPLGDGESYESWYPEMYFLTVESFYMDKYEVTNDQMVEVMQWAYDSGKLIVSSAGVTNSEGNQQELLDLDFFFCRITWDGSTFGMKSTKGSGYPCVEVTWYGAAAYCNYRSEKEGKTPCYDLSDWSCDFDVNGYRLPTSDEWQYAARGGLTGKRFPWGDTITHSEANYYSSISDSYDTSPTREHHPDYNYGGPYTSPGGSFSANGYGLYDMGGNVSDWCNTGSEFRRRLSGGGWGGGASSARCGYEGMSAPDESDPDTGLRAVSR